MLAAPVDTPLNPPPADAAASRPMVEGPAAGNTFGDHLKRAQADEKNPGEPVSRRGKMPTGIEGEPATLAEQSDPVQLICPGIVGHSDAVPSDTEINQLIHTCLTTECNHDATEAETTPIADEASVAAAIAGELIAQAVPLVVLQVRTDDRDAKVESSEDGELPSIGKMRRSARAADASVLPTKVPAKAGNVGAPAVPTAQTISQVGIRADVSQSEVTDTITVTEPPQVESDELPGEEAAPSDKANLPLPLAAESAAPVNQPAPIESTVSTVGHQEAAETPRAGRSASIETNPSDDAEPHQPAETKPNATAETSAGETLSSVTLVAPGVLPQSASVTTVSAMPQPVDGVERAHISETTSSREASPTHAPKSDVPSADTQPGRTVREPTEPTRYVREPIGTERNETVRTNLGEAERVRFVQRVARAMHTAVDRGGEIRLRLSPPELGSLTLDVVVRNGVMNARLEAETHIARSLLIDNLPALRDRLSEQNVRIDRFDVDLRDSASGSLPDRTPNHSGQQSNQRMPAVHRTVGTSSGDNRPASESIHRHIQTNDQLNVVV